jgi:hypothetical protein
VAEVQLKYFVCHSFTLIDLERAIGPKHFVTNDFPEVSMTFGDAFGAIL